MPNTMFKRMQTAVLFCLMGAFAVPAMNEQVLGVSGVDSVGGENHPQRPQSESGNDGDSDPKNESDETGSRKEDSYPAGRLSHERSPFDLVQRGQRIPGFSGSVAAPLEKHVGRTHRLSLKSPRFRRTGMSDRCFRSWLSIVAPPIKPHAPPYDREFVQKMRLSGSF